MFDIAIVVAAKNEAAHLKECIDSLLRAARREAEIIVVDDGSTDDSRSILAQYKKKIRVLDGGGKGPGHARNLALQSTDRGWIAFTDADAQVHPDWLEQLRALTIYFTHTVSSVGGVQVISRHAPSMERIFGRFFLSIGFISDYIHSSENLRTVRHNPTCNVLYRRSAIESVGGFDESLWPCEDLDLDLRLERKGFTALFTPAAVVEHRRPATFRSFFRMMKRYGFAHAQLVKKHGFCQKIHLLPLLFPLGAILLFILWHKPIWLVAATGVSIFSGWAVLAFRSKGWIPGALFTALLSVSIVCWLIGFYPGLLGQRRIATAHG